jgi:rfaE bifunctional protein nucleotidyltransferase chain/domain
MTDTGVRDRPDASAKILDQADLARRLDALRAAGKRIVHAHGVFDLLHVGHIRHLNEAHTFGDVLVVSITEDTKVNKGPHRPAFNEALRAEALASLAAVDFVTISRAATAVPLIELLRPHVYVKGPDYRNPADDRSGGITREEDAVRSVGGEIRITEDVTFSSSSLINRFLTPYSGEVQEYLAAFRAAYSIGDVHGFLDRLATMRVVVIGEAILDEYVYCDQLGKSAKEPVLAMRYVNAELFAGGALAIANHLAEFCRSVELITYVGAVDGQERFIRSNLKSNVRLNFIYKAGAPTIVKRRYVERTLLSKLFEVYQINDEPLAEGEEAEFCGLLEERLQNADAVICGDFGHGLITPAAKSLLGESGRFVAVNTQINAANVRFHAISSYPRADYICINEAELRLDARNRVATLRSLVDGLTQKLHCDRVLVTRGSLGVEGYFGGERVVSPAFATRVVDRTGSGDAVLAISAALVAAGAPPQVTAFIANVIGAQKVMIVGNRSSVEKTATYKFVETLLK